jgi:hypothetical protein
MFPQRLPLFSSGGGGPTFHAPGDSPYILGLVETGSTCKLQFAGGSQGKLTFADLEYFDSMAF